LLLFLAEVAAELLLLRESMLDDAGSLLLDAAATVNVVATFLLGAVSCPLLLSAVATACSA
jgi:hypothetical protein